MNHTPTPWKLSYFGFLENDMKHVVLYKATTLNGLSQPNDYIRDVALANSKRIVECVNAFEGVEDPAEFMATLKKYQIDQVPPLVARLEKLEAALKHIVADSNEHPYIQKLAEEALKS